MNLSSAVGVAGYGGAVLSVLIIGGGVTGSVLSSTLTALSSSSELWEKSRSTGRVSHSVARGAAAGALADLGAQYFTLGRSTRSDGDSRLLELEKAGVLARLAPGSLSGEAARHSGFTHLVAPNGAGSIVRYYRGLGLANGVVLREAMRLVSLDSVRTPGGGDDAPLIWRAESECGHVAFSRKVVLTVPAPQLHGLRGAALRLALDAPHVKDAVAAARYDTRIALALFFSALDAQTLSNALPWTGHFVPPESSSIIRYLSFETRKRSVPSATTSAAAAAAAPQLHFPCVVAHSTAPYGEKHADTPDFARVLEHELVGATLDELAKSAKMDRSAFPVPIETRVHRWKYAQVLKSAASKPSAPAAAALVASSSPPLILAGDYLAESGNVVGACESACDAAALLM